MTYHIVWGFWNIVSYHVGKALINKIFYELIISCSVHIQN